jgi:hypothetical protein
MAWIEEMTENRITGNRNLFDPIILCMIVTIYIMSLVGFEAILLQGELDMQKRASSLYGRIVNKNKL